MAVKATFLSNMLGTSNNSEYECKSLVRWWFGAYDYGHVDTDESQFELPMSLQVK